MAIWAVGDIQGCFEPFLRLLRAIEFCPEHDTLWLAGDLVNRGDGSLAMLQWAMVYEDCIQTVLGNHELHLLGIAAGHRKLRGSDTVGPILKHAQADRYIDWIRRQPFIVQDADHVMVHAGIPPGMTIKKAHKRAARASDALRSDRWKYFVRQVFERADDPVVQAVNVFTTARMVDAEGALDMKYKGGPDRAPTELRPWYKGRDDDETIVFGHWAAQGHRFLSNAIALDSGCVWGGKLTAVRLSDHRVVQVPAQV